MPKPWRADPFECTLWIGALTARADGALWWTVKLTPEIDRLADQLLPRRPPATKA